jgi:hypothetical protein
MSRTRNPWIYAIRFALISCLVISFIPVWTEWWIGSWEATGQPVPFWWMLASAARADLRHWPEFFLPQFGAMVSVFGCSFWIGRVVAWRKGFDKASPEQAVISET